MVPPGDNGSKQTEDALRQRRGVGQAVMLGTNIAAGMIVFTLVGYYLDHKRGTGHFWTLAGMFMGMAYAAYEFWSTLRVLNEQDTVKPRPDPADKGGVEKGNP